MIRHQTDPFAARIAIAAILAVVALGAAVAARGSAPSATLAFVDVAVVPMDREEVLPRRSVVVQDGRIVRVGPADEVEIPAGARRIDGRGRWLMPGLSDMHVHLFGATDLDLYLANGVTTVRNLGGWGAADTVLALRERVAAGRTPGPAIYTSGNWLDGDPPYRSINTAVASPEEARRVVADQAAAGYDFVKVYAALAPEVYLAIVAAAREAGIPITGHVPQALTVTDVLAAGQASIDHVGNVVFFHFGADLDPAEIPAIARRIEQAGTAVVSTLSVFDSRIAQRRGESRALEGPETRYLAPHVREYWAGALEAGPVGSAAPLETRFDFTRRVARGLMEAGARLMLGTDADVVGVVPGFSVHRELELLVGSGLTPYQALRTATVHPADFLRETVAGVEPFGRVAEGHRADLLLLEENPLEDVGNARRIVGVMAAGRWLAAEELERRLRAVAYTYGEEER